MDRTANPTADSGQDQDPHNETIADVRAVTATHNLLIGWGDEEHLDGEDDSEDVSTCSRPVAGNDPEENVSSAPKRDWLFHG